MTVKMQMENGKKDAMKHGKVRNDSCDSSRVGDERKTNEKCLDNAWN